MKECDLAKPVAEWLRGKDYTVYSEVPFPYGAPRVIDMVGIDTEKHLIVVELKRSATKEVFCQIGAVSLITPDVYICTGSKPKKATIEKCRKYHVGMIWYNGQINVAVEPARDKSTAIHFRNRMLERLDFMEPSDNAGKPNQKGEGPAIDCAKRVKEYLKTNTVKSWCDIFHHVENHYSNWKSMRSVMTGNFHIQIPRKRSKKTDFGKQQMDLELI